MKRKRRKRKPRKLKYQKNERRNIEKILNFSLKKRNIEKKRVRKYDGGAMEALCFFIGRIF